MLNAKLQVIDDLPLLHTHINIITGVPFFTKYNFNNIISNDNNMC